MLLDLFITYITSLEPKTKLQAWMLNEAFVELREVEDYRVENDPFYPIQVIKSCWRYIELEVEHNGELYSQFCDMADLIEDFYSTKEFLEWDEEHRPYVFDPDDVPF